MGDALERFVTTHRQAFDSELPSEDLWERIRTNHDQRKPFTWGQLWKVAAVVLLLSTTYLLVERQFSTPAPQMEAQRLDLSSVESYYVQVIQEKKEQLLASDQGELTRSFLKELEALDRSYNELKTTYQERPGADRISDAMINNLKLRIDLLNRQLNVLQKLKTYKNENEVTI